VAPTRTGSSRRVRALPTLAVAVLVEHRRRQVRQLDEDQPFVFSRPDGGPQRASSLRTRCYQLLEGAGLPCRRFHDLRRAYASLQIEAGEELTDITKALGHSNLSTTADIYAHLTPKSRRRMADTMDRTLTG
jgi:integrase